MNSRLNRNRGKRAEKAIASILNSKRIGILGGEDISHEIFSIEVKSRKKFSGAKFMKQAISNTQPGKIPIVVVHIHAQRHQDDLVMLRLEDFQTIGLAEYMNRSKASKNTPNRRGLSA